MSNYGEIKQAVLGCVTRQNASFQSGQVNLVDIAVNNAVIYAQRQKDFEWCKGLVSIDCNPKGSLMNAKDESGLAVKLKRIVKAYGINQPTGHDETSIRYLSRASQTADNTGMALSGNRPCSPSVIHDGMSVYITPQQIGPHVLWFYAVKWLPRFIKDSDTNFFLEYGFDYIMYRSLVELNFYLKEDERFPINKTLLSDTWESLSTWDNSLVSPTETEINF